MTLSNYFAINVALDRTIRAIHRHADEQYRHLTQENRQLTWLQAEAERGRADALQALRAARRSSPFPKSLVPVSQARSNSPASHGAQVTKQGAIIETVAGYAIRRDEAGIYLDDQDRSPDEAVLAMLKHATNMFWTTLRTQGRDRFQLRLATAVPEGPPLTLLRPGPGWRARRLPCYGCNNFYENKHAHGSCTPDQQANGWKAVNLGGSWTARPAVVVDSSGNAELLAIGDDSTVYYSKQTAPGQWSPNEWTKLSAAAWGQYLNANQAMAKASELCQKKGGTDIKMLLSRNSDPVTGMLFCSIAASGHGPSAIVGVGYGTIPPAADGAAFVDCRQRGGTRPHIVVGWKERALDGMVPNTRAGKF